MDFEHFKEALFDIVSHNKSTFRPEDQWFAWFAVHLYYYVSKYMCHDSNDLSEDDYDQIAVWMQMAATGHAAKSVPPSIEV
jgi:hypothetical protein